MLAENHYRLGILFNLLLQFTLERVVVDFIQWLGDSNADNLYQTIISTRRR